MQKCQATEVHAARAPGGVSDGNRATLFDDGEALFEEKAEAVRNARERVWIETFLFTPDKTGQATLELTSEAARRGCDVVLLFDQLGSHVTSLGFHKPLVEAGGRVAIFNPLPLWRRYGRRLGSFLQYRDHRKVVIVDDVGFTGGHNFSRAYMGPPPHHFYDMSVKLEGPCVRDLASVFLDGFRAATGETRPLPARSAPLPDGVRAQVHAFDAQRGPDDLVRAYQQALDSSREDALLIFGYFVPDEPLRAPLIAAAERGVRVRLLAAGATDFPFIRWAGQHTFDRLLAAGIRIWQLQEPNLHAKSLVVDGELCMIGSFDVNKYERRNYAEVAVTVHDTALARRIEEGFCSCLERSQEITPADRKQRSLITRAVEWASYRMMRI